MVHDWDSVTADSEAVLAGFAAALYSTVSVETAGHRRGNAAVPRGVPRCHGRELSADELELSWAAGVWTRAYDARYQHAVRQPVRSLTENAARERTPPCWDRLTEAHRAQLRRLPGRQPELLGVLDR